MLSRVNFHSANATVSLQKLSEWDVGFGSLSLHCKHRDAEEDLVVPGGPKDNSGKPLTAPAWTDGKVIYYGPGFAAMTLKQQMAVAAHEISHISLRHISRAGALHRRFGRAFNSFLFNVATDAIINEMLLLAEFELPRPCIVLTELLENAFGEKLKPEEAISKYDSETLYIRLKRLKPEGGGSGDMEGEGQPGDSGEAELPDVVKEFLKEKNFSPDFHPDLNGHQEDRAEDRRWQQRFDAAISASRTYNSGAGTGLGKIGHMIADIPKSKTPWETLIRRDVTKAVTRMPVISYEYPTRRFLAMDADARLRGIDRPVFEPGMVMRKGVPRVLVGVDVSGSIDDQTLKLFTGEIAGIGRRTGAEIHVVVFDSVVISVTKISALDLETEIRKIKFARGGGTSFTWLEDMKHIDPSIIVVLTDLCGPHGKAPKKVPVLWAVPNNERPAKPPYGRVISLAA